MIVVTLILVCLGLFLCAVGAAGMAGVLPGNPYVGLRIPEVRKSPELWVVGHKIAGRAWLGAGVALCVAAIVSVGASGWLWLIVALLVVGAVVLVGVGAGVAAHAVAVLDAKNMAAEDTGGCCSSSAEGTGCGDSAGSCEPRTGSRATGTTTEPTAEECASGSACGSCSLNGACEDGQASIDVSGIWRAAQAQDQRERAPKTP